MSDSTRLGRDLAALIPLRATESRLPAAQIRLKTPPRTGEGTVASISGSGSGGGGDIREDAARARTHHPVSYLSSPDGMLVIEFAQIATLPVLDGAQSPLTWTILGR